MDLISPCRPFSRVQLKSLEAFLDNHPDVLGRLSGGQQDTFVRLCGYVSHLRSRKAVGFFMQTLHAMEHLVDPGNSAKILNAAVQLAARNWAMVHPFFSCLEFMDTEDDFFDEWTLFARMVADLDIDVAVTFLQETPEAIKILGRDEVLSWGSIALRALEHGPPISRATRAYLCEAVSNRCSTTPERWDFNLSMASRIAQVSPVAAEDATAC